MPEVYVEKIGSRWYYSEETVDNIDKLHKDTFPIEWTFLDEHFPEFFAYTVYGYYIWKPVLAIVIILICILLYYILEPAVYFLLRQMGRVLALPLSRKQSRAGAAQ